jgi:serine/threonine protein kinase
MALSPGNKLGPYEIIAAIGAGGMGEVYRAKDTRLGRDVAIKVMPEALVKDADRLRRFEQEARTVAALNHPNILGIDDIGTHEGAPSTGACYFAVKSYDRKSRGSILLQERSGGGWNGSMDRDWEIFRRTGKRFYLTNGEDPQGRCT